MTKRILSVSYDEPLLKTRELLLARHGFDVTSALGFTEARELCKTDGFDLFILGHSIPESDQRELIQTFRQKNHAPVLVLLRGTERQLEPADHHVSAFDPAVLEKKVQEILGD